MRIENAVIIYGPGRSGTTILSKILSMHDNFYWISGYCDHFPSLTGLSILNRINYHPKIELLTRKIKKMPRPAEAYGFWIYYLPKFNYQEILESDIDSDQIKKCLHAIKKIQFWTGKKRFITKITGNTRIEYIQRLFNNPYIIWIERDPRLVVMSYHKQRWSYKKNIREFYNKSEEELIAEYSKMYIKYYNEKEKLKQFNYKQVFYENIVSDRYNFFQDIFEFIREKQNRAFHEIIDTWIIKKDTDEFYKNYFTNDGMILLNNLLKKPLQELGYTSVS